MGEWVLSSKYRSCLKYSLEVRTNSHLLLQLRRLSKTCLSIELLEFEYLSSSFTSSWNQFRSENLNKIVFETVISLCLCYLSFDFHYWVWSLCTEVKPSIVESGISSYIDLFLVLVFFLLLILLLFVLRFILLWHFIDWVQKNAVVCIRYLEWKNRGWETDYL